MRLRENLRSYVEEHMQIAADTGTPHSRCCLCIINSSCWWSGSGLPVLRPMFIDFPTDPMCATEDVASQFMFGPDWYAEPNSSERDREGVIARRITHTLHPTIPGWLHPSRCTRPQTARCTCLHCQRLRLKCGLIGTPSSSTVAVKLCRTFQLLWTNSLSSSAPSR